MPDEPYIWMKLAGNFPPALVTNMPSSMLSEGFSPDCSNIDIGSDGYMKAGTIPSGTTRAVRQYTIATNVYDWHYGRCWRFSVAQVIYNAPDYTSVYLAQGKGTIDLNQSSGNILKMLPIGETGLIFLRSGGSNILKNANDNRGFFYQTDYMQEVSISTASHAVELDGVVYYVNASGLFSVDIEGRVKELSNAVYGNITAAALTADYLRKYIIIGTTRAYNVQQEKFFKYDGGTLAYYSPKLRNKDNTATIAVDKVAFEYDKTSTKSGTIKFKIETEDRDWSREYKCSIINQDDASERTGWDVDPYIGLSWQLHMTQLPTNLKLKNIWVRIKGFTPESRES